MSRRNARDSRRGGGGGAAAPFVYLSAGAFARSLAAYQRDRDPTSGGDWSQVATGVLRYETLTSGGRLALIEGARTNNIRSNRARAGTGWVAGSGLTETSGQTGIDGTAAAYRSQVNSGGFSRYSTSLATAGPFVASQFERQGGSDVTYHAQVYNGAIFSHSEGTTGLGAAWMRSVIRVLTGTSANYIPTDGRAGAIVAAGARDTIADFPQVEAGRFASSPILVSGASAVTRPADTLTFAAAPAGLLTDVHGFTHVRPLFTSTLEVVDTDAFWLLHFAGGGAGGGVVLRQASGVLTIDLVDNAGVTRAQSQPLATLADDDLGSVVWDLANGRIYVDGTPGPAGAACTWSAGAYRVGGIHGGAGEAFCGLSDIY